MSEQIIDLLDRTGDGTGLVTLDTNGAATPAMRGRAVPAGLNHYKVEQIQLYFEDDAAIDANGSFLNLAPAAALANGLQVGVWEHASGVVVNPTDTQVFNLFGSNNLTTATVTGDFEATGWDYNVTTFALGDSIVTVTRIFREPLIVVNGTYLGVRIQDNLAAFTRAFASFVAKAA